MGGSLMRLTVQLKVSEKTNKRKLLLLEELYGKYQTALKPFLQLR